MKRPAALLILSVLWLVVPCAWGVVAFTTLVSFTGTSGVYPGAYPYAGLALGSDGNFYGTTSSGGTNNHGTIFQLTPGGAFTSLLSFNGTNGAAPYAAPVQGADGNFYGTTFNGGVSNWGTIYRITTNGTFTNLFSFTGANNPYLGANPGAALVPAADGSFSRDGRFGRRLHERRPDYFRRRLRDHIPIDHQRHGGRTGLPAVTPTGLILPADWCWDRTAIFTGPPCAAAMASAAAFRATARYSK